MRCVFCASTPLLRIFFSFFESSSRTSLGRYFGLSLLGLSLWSRVLCAPLSRLGETRTDLGRRVDNSFGLLTVCRPKKELFSPCVFTKTHYVRNMNDAVSPEKPSKRRGARDDDRRLSPLAFLSPSFFCRRKARKREPFDDIIFFSLLLFFSTNDPKTHVACHLSLSLFVKSTKVCVDWRVSPVWISPRKLPTPSSNCAARTSRPWRSSPC